MTDDLQQQGTDTDTAPTSPAGQSESWEARFKGLQKKYQELEASLNGSKGYATKLENEKRDLEQRLANITQSHQGEITRLSADLETERTSRATLEQQVQSLTAEQQRLAHENSVTQILASEYPDLLPFYQPDETGVRLLNVGDKSGDDLRTVLNTFRNKLGQRVTGDVEDKLKGGSPPQPTPGGGDLTLEQRHDWLLSHDDTHPDYQTMLDAYYNALPR